MRIWRSLVARCPRGDAIIPSLSMLPLRAGILVPLDALNGRSNELTKLSDKLTLLSIPARRERVILGTEIDRRLRGNTCLHPDTAACADAPRRRRGAALLCIHPRLLRVAGHVKARRLLRADDALMIASVHTGGAHSCGKRIGAIPVWNEKCIRGEQVTSKAARYSELND